MLWFCGLIYFFGISLGDFRSILFDSYVFVDYCDNLYCIVK